MVGGWVDKMTLSQSGKAKQEAKVSSVISVLTIKNSVMLLWGIVFDQDAIYQAKSSRRQRWGKADEGGKEIEYEDGGVKEEEGEGVENSRKSVRWSAVPVAPQVVFGSA